MTDPKNKRFYIVTYKEEGKTYTSKCDALTTAREIAKQFYQSGQFISLKNSGGTVLPLGTKANHIILD